MTDDVLSVLFQQCVPSFQSIHCACADRFLDQVPGTTIHPSHRIPNSQRCRPAGQNGSNLVRDTSTGHSGQGKFGWVHFEEGLGHVRRLIYLISLRFVISLASNHSIILRFENTTAGGSQEGGIHGASTCRRTNGVVRHLPTLVFRENRIVQLVKRSKLFLVNEIKLAEIGQLSLLTKSLSLRTSCTKRKKCR